MKEIEKPMEGYTTAKFIPGDFTGNVGNLEPLLHPPKQLHDCMTEELCLKKPELIIEIQKGGTVEINNPREILPVGDGTVILVNEGLNDLQRIDTNGNVVQVYNLEKAVQSAAVDMKNLFVAFSDRTILMMAIHGSRPRVTYKPDVDNMGRITATGMYIVVSNLNASDGKIYDFNKEQTKVCVSGLKTPGFVTTATIQGEQKCIVTESGTKKVRIYDSCWKLLHSITNRGGSAFSDPAGNAITPGGKLLVADNGNNTLSEFKLDGTFVRDILTNPAINKPNSILYDYPYLWVSETTPALKLFRVD